MSKLRINELESLETGRSLKVDEIDSDVRLDLSNHDKGAAMVARGVVAVDSIADLSALPESARREDLRYLVKGYHGVWAVHSPYAGAVGGGEFNWLPDAPKSQHDGGLFIDPDRAFPADWNDDLALEEWFSASSNTGLGCFGRPIPNDGVSADLFGAKADFDFSTGTGTTNDRSFNKAIQAATATGSTRTKGNPCFRVPTGQYKLRHIDINTSPVSGFGLRIVGEPGSSLYFDEEYSGEAAISCTMEGVYFVNMSLFGSLTSVNVPVGRSPGIVAKKTNNAPDIDITFRGCDIRSWDTFCEVHGRGFVFTGGGLGGVGTFCKIINEVYNVGGAQPNRTMRHYRLQGSRVDACGFLFVLSGSNTAEQVNHIQISGNDIISNDRAVVVQGNHTINGLAFNSNVSSGSYATMALLVHNIRNATITGNVFMHQTDADELPTTNGGTVGNIVVASGYARSVSISGNTIKNLRETIITVNGDSDAVSVGPNTLDECYSFNSDGPGGTLCSFKGSRGRIVVRGNACSGVATTGVFRQTSIPATSMTKDISVGSNPAPWVWDDLENLNYLSVYSGGNDVTSQIPQSSRACVYVVDDGYVSGSVVLGSAGVAPGRITLSLPLAAESITGNLSSVPGGGGRVIRYSGLSSVGYSLGDVLVNAAEGRFELFKEKDLELVPLNWGDVTESGYIVFTFRYKMG